ncbi:MAG: HIT domain-containing protein [Caulobacteraceae bacterium]
MRAIGAALGRPVEKLNVGALGNVTPQLHVHVVGRRADDAAWPARVEPRPGAGL